jgi:hypothetical protein
MCRQVANIYNKISSALLVIHGGSCYGFIGQWRTIRTDVLQYETQHIRKVCGARTLLYVVLFLDEFMCEYKYK